jgi:hypothetical protein
MYRLEPSEEYDRFILGVIQVQCIPRLVYDEEALIEHIATTIDRSDMTSADWEIYGNAEDYVYQVAVEHYEYNIVRGADALGEGAPVFLSRTALEEI